MMLPVRSQHIDIRKFYNTMRHRKTASVKASHSAAILISGPLMSGPLNSAICSHWANLQSSLGSFLQAVGGLLMLQIPLSALLNSNAGHQVYMRDNASDTMDPLLAWTDQVTNLHLDATDSTISIIKQQCWPSGLHEG